VESLGSLGVTGIIVSFGLFTLSDGLKSVNESSTVVVVEKKIQNAGFEIFSPQSSKLEDL